MPTTVAATGSGDAGGGYQTVAIVPDGSSGGYVLIVQPGQSVQQGQTLQLPVGAGGANLITTNSQIVTGSVVTEKDVDDVPAPTRPRLTRVKKEKEVEKPNDISVYDFDEGTY